MDIIFDFDIIEDLKDNHDYYAEVKSARAVNGGESIMIIFNVLGEDDEEENEDIKYKDAILFLNKRINPGTVQFNFIQMFSIKLKGNTCNYIERCLKGKRVAITVRNKNNYPTVVNIAEDMDELWRGNFDEE